MDRWWIIVNIINKVNYKIILFISFTVNILGMSADNILKGLVKPAYFEDLNNKLTTKQKEIDALKQVMCLNDYIDEYKNTEQEIQVEE